ncbi:MAG: TonB-dependent receptor plug domain-containing protein [Vitreimonas sp.]
MKRRLVTASAAAMAAVGATYAQQPPAPPPPPPPAESQQEEDASADEIVVEATGDQVRIDRRTYTLRDDAAAQATNMFDVLGRIPSVSVSPDGAVTLLGAPNVEIQINGQPVPGGNLEQILRGLPGSEVERIEVITNPSAQYSAQASGGIINIITRQRFDQGFNGTIQASDDSLGNYHFGVAPSLSRGRWAFSGQVGLYGGGQENELTRGREDFATGALTTEEGDNTFDYSGWYASRLQAAYRLDDRRRLSAAISGGEFNGEGQRQSELADATGTLTNRTSLTENGFESEQVSFEFQQTGEPREMLKLTGALNRFTNTSDALLTDTPAGGGAANQFATTYAQDTTSANIKLDVERPRPQDRFLTYGAAFDMLDQELETGLQLLSGVGPPSYQLDLACVQQTLAAYATYQFDTGDWTWLPGLRAEHYRREVVSVGLESDTDDARLFPSLHIRRALTESINIDLSYTSRIQRPGFQQLDPAVRFFDVNRAFSGNPTLKPTTTDAYEANIVYQKDGANFSLTFFDRISDDVVSQFTQLTPDGVVLSMPVNAGTSEQRGLQAILRGPIGEHWRYSLSGNVLEREFDVLSGGAISRRSETEYDGIAQLDYSDADQNAVGADQLQFEVRFQGPRFGLQSETEANLSANFTWRRRVTRRLFAVASVQDIFDSTDQINEVTTDEYFERTVFRGAGTRFRLALTYQFGEGPQRPMQDQQAPAPPVPMH